MPKRIGPLVWWAILSLCGLPLLVWGDVETAIRLYTAERYREGKILLEQFLTTHQRDAIAHYYLGKIHLELQDYDKAIEHCKTAADIQTQNAEHYFCLGMGYGKKARNASFVSKAFLAPKIKRSFEKTVALDPHHIQGRIGLANFYLRAPPLMGGDIDKAHEQAMILLKLNAEKGRQLLDKVLQRKVGDAAADESTAQEQEILSD